MNATELIAHLTAELGEPEVALYDRKAFDQDRGQFESFTWRVPVADAMRVSMTLLSAHTLAVITHWPHDERGIQIVVHRDVEVQP